MSSDRKNCERATTQIFGLGGMITNKTVDAFVRDFLTLHSGDSRARLTISMDYPPLFKNAEQGLAQSSAVEKSTSSQISRLGTRYV